VQSKTIQTGCFQNHWQYVRRLKQLSEWIFIEVGVAVMSDCDS